MRASALLGLLVPFGALAEEHVPFRPTTSGPFVTLTAPIPPRGRLVAQPIFSVAFAHASLGPQGEWLTEGPQDGLRTTALTFFSEYGVADALSFGGQLAVIHHDRQRASSFGLGELQLFGRRFLFAETAGGLPEATLLFQLKIPTANAEGVESLRGTDVRGSGSADLTIGLDLTRGIRPVLVHADLLLTQPLPARVGQIDTHFGTVLSWAISVEWPFLPERLALMLEANGRHQLAPTLGGERTNGHTDEVIVGAGVEILFTPDVQLLVGYQRTVWGRNVGAFDTVVATLVPVLF
jgi:hypothetical protein